MHSYKEALRLNSRAVIFERSAAARSGGKKNDRLLVIDLWAKRNRLAKLSDFQDALP
jgi:hypothetical protein